MNDANDSQGFLADYDPRAYEPIAVTVDVVALTVRDAELQVLLVRRGEQPYQGSWALPGGFVRPRTGPGGERVEEDLAQTAARELAEEAGPRLRPTHLEQLGSYGAVVLADVRRLDDCFPSVNYFETRDLPFIVAVNCFDDAPRYDLTEIRIALDLDEDVPVVLCDARDHGSVKDTLIRLVESIAASGAPPAPAPGRTLIVGR